jgi:ABC-type branched-subunit amino acid transport system substrate-binding protein
MPERKIFYRNAVGGTMRRGGRTGAALLATVAIVAAVASPAAGQEKPKADDVGITDSEIRIAIVADVDNPIVPGLFKSAVDSIRAWATTVNKQGGVAGRKVVVDFIDSKLNPNEARNALITACSQDFALVGTEALFINNVADLEQCKNKQGQPVGMPDLPGIASSAERCSPVTYYLQGSAAYCATKDDHPQTYTAQQGDYRYYLETNKDLHGIWLAPADVKDVKNAAVPSYQAGMNLGIDKDGEGVYDVFARDPQSALTPKIQVVKQSGSTFVYNGSSAAMMVLARREANLQGVNTVKVWACHQGCYDQAFLEQGGADVEGTHSSLLNLAFYTDYKSNPALRSLAKEIGGVGKMNSYGVSALIAALLFQDAAEKAVAGGGTLTRQSLFDALKSEHDFDAQGVIGPVDIGNHATPRCIVMAQVKDGKWVREYPKKPGTFDCSKRNIIDIEMDQN